ncbi:SGNH/GDSL hydrolase family protein [uncultured Subdoligranulum sp.]|uniref:SGNH/GDSL hydrolase family protein n=1 Tax=uncultured Subdoligranulum sp. TaxID=512298 RepID=UPI002611B7AF|nr:SGNH/GDSL hydrolase family protein [uncultured Subdoligranulum sp.]
MAGRSKEKTDKKPLDTRSKMYLVMGMCSLMLLVSVAISFVLVGGLDAVGADSGADAASDSDSLVTESGYNKDQNTIDQTQYSSTILEESEDAGQDYVDETLFLGDSNTARMYRMFDYCSYDNAIGSVGMSARSLATYACVQLQGYSNYVTMAKAVSLMQPRRVILTFGTNDLSPSYSAQDFVENYQEGIESIVEAYPSVDIIVNAIPPLGQTHSNQNLTQTQVDEYNKALVEMCQEQGWKFLNSAEVLKDSSTGYAKSGYVESSDGIHLTRAAMEALFDYVRTHSYITEDDRPTVKNVAKHVGDKDVSTTTAASVTTTSSSSAASESVASSEVVATPTPTAAPTPQPTVAPTPEPTQAPTPSPAPSPTPESTPSPTPEPTPSPTPDPTPSATPSPTPDPTPTPVTNPTPTPTDSSGTPDNSTGS